MYIEQVDTMRAWTQSPIKIRGTIALVLVLIFGTGNELIFWGQLSVTESPSVCIRDANGMERHPHGTIGLSFSKLTRATLVCVARQ